MFGSLKNYFQSTAGLIGLNISADDEIKLLHLISTKEGYHLTYCANLTVPPETIIKQEIQNIEAISNVLAATLKVMPIACRKIAIAVPDSQVISKVIQVEAGLTEKELEAHVWFEANKHIPYPIEEINLDFQVLGVATENVQLVDVLIVAVRKDTLMPYLLTIANVGLSLAIVDVESHAVMRASKYLQATANDKASVAVINLDNIKIALTVLGDGQRLFTRSEWLSENTLEEVISTWRHMLQFFLANHPYKLIKEIFLAGSSKLLPVLAAHLVREFKIKVNIANPFNVIGLAKNIDKEKLQSCAAEFLISCGLALRC